MIPRVERGSEIFPTARPVTPEERLIGRKAVIDSLEDEAIAHRTSLLLLEQRRVGKTSLARAVLSRHRRKDGLAFELDLSDTALAAPTHLSLELAAQARAAGVGVARGQALAEKAVVAAKAAGGATRAIRGVLQIFDRQTDTTAGLGHAADAFGEIETALGSFDATSPPALAQVLEVLGAAADHEEQPIVVFIDECQRLAAWEDAQHAVAHAMRRETNGLVFLFAGSDQTALSQLFAIGKPLHHDGLRRRLPQISTDAWIPALIARFGEAGIESTADDILAILEASKGHPQRTMQVCAHTRRWASDAGRTRLDEITIASGIASAKEQPAWRL